MSTPSAPAVPWPRSSSQTLDRWAIRLAWTGAAVLAASGIAYVVAWAVFPSAETSAAAAATSAVAAYVVLVGVASLGAMSPLVPMLGVRAIDVRSAALRYKLVYAIGAIVVTVALMAGVYATLAPAVDALWSRWPQ